MSVESSYDPHNLLTAAEAAALLPQTTSQTVLRWAKEGQLPYVELPGGRRRRKFFRREDIEALLQPRVAPSAGSPAESPDGVLPGQPVLSWPSPASSASPAAAGGASS